MAEAFEFRVLATDGLARRGTISMPRGTVQTPAFMPISTFMALETKQAAYCLFVDANYRFHTHGDGSSLLRVEDQ